ncbi:PGAP1-like protein-domain-containing protein [Lipomyces japonicus]|uniref:PGAP1-like protein-domain-containing protein n=1 Tax=Lipomyces japonicus TaxID=56871 RepID=UPI0034CF93CA
MPAVVVSPPSRPPLARYTSRHRRLLSQHGSYLTILIALLSAFTLAGTLYSFLMRQLDSRGCQMSYMYPSYARIKSFDNKHTRFAEKYALYLYREQTVDRTVEPTGVPVLFIPGNAGSYKQARSIAAEAARRYYDAVVAKGSYGDEGSANLDFFTADFNEDFTAFHGRTLLDQAEYLNDAIEFILSLYQQGQSKHAGGYHDDRPAPRSVILLGHSMGGIVARTMLTLPNYRPDSVNTILTLSAPHVQAPASFDWDLVRIYEKINRYWRESYSDALIGRNPLASVSLVSIAGGKLDVVVPSDYASVSSLVPNSNGFTVFTTTMPNVWTATDHQAIVWCDQCRKAIAKALLDIVDARAATKTKKLSTRMQVFRNIFLTGLETPRLSKSLYSLNRDTLLKVPNSPGVFLNEGKQLALQPLGAIGKSRAYLLPIPKSALSRDDFFSILTDQVLEIDGKDQTITVLLCEKPQPDLDSGSFATVIDVGKVTEFSSSSSSFSTSISLPCTNAALDKVILPASNSSSKNAHDGGTFEYLRFKVSEINTRYDYVAIVDSFTTSSSSSPGFVLAEMIRNNMFRYELDARPLIAGGGHVQIPATRPGFVEISARSASNSLISYKLRLHTQPQRKEEEEQQQQEEKKEFTNQGCDKQMFTPLVRQFTRDPNESKFFPNAQARTIDINLHGTAPFVPRTVVINENDEDTNDLKLQIWMDSTCGRRPIDVYLTVDWLGSLGNFVVRYRTALAALPLAIVSAVLLMQFNIYDAEGVFVSFGTGLELFIGRALPIVMAGSWLLTIVLAYGVPARNLPFADTGANDDNHGMLMITNEIFLGLTEPRLAFLGPIFFVIAAGLCVAVYYVTTAALLLIAKAIELASKVVLNRDKPRAMLSPSSSLLPSAAAVGVVSGSRRMVTILVLLVSVLMFVPYQFAYVVAFLVQVNTCLKSLVAGSSQINLQAGGSSSSSNNGQFNTNFVNFAFSILMLMTWVLPINVPLLIVWVHNLSVRWTTPFSSHHNVLSIVPLILLVERMIGGNMVPQQSPRGGTYRRQGMVTNLILGYIIIYACLHGILNAYWLHHLVNGFAFWLLVLYLDIGSDRDRHGPVVKLKLNKYLDKRP